MGPCMFDEPIQVEVIRRIYLTNFVIIIKLELSNFPLFSHSMVVCLRWLWHHIMSVCLSVSLSPLSLSLYIYIQGYFDLGFHYYCTAYDACRYSNTLRLEGRICLFAYYIISLSSSCRPILNHWIYAMPLWCILSSVYLRTSQLCQLHFMQYIAVVRFQLTLSPLMEVKMYVLYLIIIKSKVWTISHCLSLGHETMAWAVCLAIFLLLLLPY